MSSDVLLPPCRPLVLSNRLWTSWRPGVSSRTWRPGSFTTRRPSAGSGAPAAAAPPSPLRRLTSQTWSMPCRRKSWVSGSSPRPAPPCLMLSTGSRFWSRLRPAGRAVIGWRDQAARPLIAPPAARPPKLWKSRTWASSSAWRPHPPLARQPQPLEQQPWKTGFTRRPRCSRRAAPMSSVEATQSVSVTKIVGKKLWTSGSSSRKDETRMVSH